MPTELNELSFTDRLAALTLPLPKELVKTMPGSGGATLSYIEWHTTCAILNFWFDGQWSSVLDGPTYQQTFPISLSSFRQTTTGGLSPGNTQEGTTFQTEIVCQTTLTISDLNGNYVSHDGVGQDTLFLDTKYGWIYNDKGVTSAESHSFKRAATKFGIGTELYDKDQKPTCLYRYLAEYPINIGSLRIRSMCLDLLLKEKLTPDEARAIVTTVEDRQDMATVNKTSEHLASLVDS